MADRRPSLVALRFVLCVTIPLGIAVILNAIVRPALAAQLGGVHKRSTTTSRSANSWWEFDAATREAHPALTAFLEVSNGALATLMLALAAVSATVFLLLERRRRRSAG